MRQNMLVARRLHTRRTSDTIEDYFSFMGRTYVRTTHDLTSNSNYLPKVNNTLKDIKDPWERIAVTLVADRLYR